MSGCGKRPSFVMLHVSLYRGKNLALSCVARDCFVHLFTQAFHNGDTGQFELPAGRPLAEAVAVYLPGVPLAQVEQAVAELTAPLPGEPPGAVPMWRVLQTDRGLALQITGYDKWRTAKSTERVQRWRAAKVAAAAAVPVTSFPTLRGDETVSQPFHSVSGSTLCDLNSESESESQNARSRFPSASPPTAEPSPAAPESSERLMAAPPAPAPVAPPGDPFNASVTTLSTNLGHELAEALGAGVEAVAHTPWTALAGRGVGPAVLALAKLYPAMLPAPRVELLARWRRLGEAFARWCDANRKKGYNLFALQDFLADSPGHPALLLAGAKAPGLAVTKAIRDEAIRTNAGVIGWTVPPSYPPGTHTAHLAAMEAERVRARLAATPIRAVPRGLAPAEDFTRLLPVLTGAGR